MYCYNTEYGFTGEIATESKLCHAITYIIKESPEDIVSVPSSLANLGIISDFPLPKTSHMTIHYTPRCLLFSLINDEFWDQNESRIASTVLSAAVHEYADCIYDDMDILGEMTEYFENKESCDDEEDYSDEEDAEYEAFVEALTDRLATFFVGLLSAMASGGNEPAIEEKPSKSRRVQRKPQKARREVYCVSPSEAIDYMPYAECLYSYGGNLFLLAKEGYLLDDFLRRGNPNAIKGRRIDFKEEMAT